MKKLDKPQLRAVDEADQAALAEEQANARRRGIYLLPNIITTGALFSGFYATIAGMNGRFGAAVLAIFAAIAPRKAPEIPDRNFLREIRFTYLSDKRVRTSFDHGVSMIRKYHRCH